jgi:NAD+ diphosphatase
MNYLSNTHPSRIFSFCPKCSHKDFKFENAKYFKCGKCGFQFYINAASAVAAILVADNGKIILARRKNEPCAGKFDLPGGFVDIMERVEDAVKREVFEELGIKVSDMQFFTSFPNEYEYKGISYFTCDMAFICPVTDLSELKASDDVAEAILIDPKNIDFSVISFPSVINILKAYQDKSK